MSDQATERKVISAPPAAVWSVIIDFAAYPQWADDVKEVEILETTGTEALVVSYTAMAFGRSAHYSLRYDWSESPTKLSWKQESADLTNRIDGSYELIATGNSTEVVYTLDVDLKMPVPGFLKRRTESKIMQAALEELATRAEKVKA